MYRENYINALRTELLEMVAEQLSPVALKYGYSDVPMEANIKWRPQVLVLGNYSSGKSTLINEFLGATIQKTGQAPTDDSFTIITYDDSTPPSTGIRVTEERDGKVLLKDPEYPYETLKKHGQRFASHFRLKKVNSPFLRSLALIDTPGMLDSITERDRGYSYQEVIGDLAQNADLVLVLFDPHKAGTVREAHESLRDTLPARTFEDRLLFVLNRIDECTSLNDLLRVYGTLCWNLSQITGRKDIPMIHLTYSTQAASAKDAQAVQASGFLKYLDNQKEELKSAILQAPRHRLDNLASFVETHSERLSHLLEALISYRLKLRRHRLKYMVTGTLCSLLLGSAAVGAAIFFGLLPGLDPYLLGGIAGAVTLTALMLWVVLLRPLFEKVYYRRQIKHLDELTPLNNQTRRDSWHSVRELVLGQLKQTRGRYGLKILRQEYASVSKVHEKGAAEIREALSELAGIPADYPLEAPPSPNVASAVPGAPAASQAENPRDDRKFIKIYPKAE